MRPQREHTANILDAPKSYAQQSPAKPQNILTIDCRGLEFLEFKPDVRSISCGLPSSLITDDKQGPWKATGVESGTAFSDIDLTEGDWYEYDEKASEEVSIKDVKWSIRRA